MIESEKKKLFEYENRYLGIGISPGGIVYNSIPVPWHSTAHAFNMRTPDIFLSEEDVRNPEILDELKKFRVIGCYIFTPLEDYSFLAEFTELQDLFIQCGHNVSDLSFTKNMKELFMLFLEDANIQKIEDVFGQHEKSLHSYCMGFYQCKIEDISSLVKSQVKLSELLIWNEAGREEREKWKAVPALKYIYRTIENGI